MNLGRGMSICFLFSFSFSSDFSFNSELLKKKSHARRRCLVGLMATVTEF